MSLSGFCRERLHRTIVNGSVQLLFGSGHKGGGGSRTHNVRSGTRHIHDAGDGRKQDDGFHRQTGSGKQRRCGNGRRAGHTDRANGNTASRVGQMPAQPGIPRFAPRLAPKAATSSFTPSFRVSWLTVTGIVPTLLWEVKATVAAGQMPLKKRTGLSLPTNLIRALSTTKT